MEGAEGQLPPVVDQDSHVVRDLFEAFLEDHLADDGQTHDYIQQLAIMATNHRSSIYIDFGHVRDYHVALSDHIEAEYVKYEPFLAEAVYNVAFKHQHEFERDQDTAPTREYWVHFYNMPTVLKLRDLKSSKVGKLASFCGTVTRTTEVHPELMLGTFHCLDCNSLISNVEQRFRFTQPQSCVKVDCLNTRRWRLDIEKSKFVDWQKVRVQENANEIPSGSMPRHMEVILRQDAVEKAKAGDKCIFIGTLIVIPDLSAAKLPGGTVTLDRQADEAAREGEGLAGLREQGVRPLTFKLAFLASTVRPLSSQLGVVNIREDEALEGDSSEQRQEDVLAQLSLTERHQLVRMRHEPHLYRKLARSIAPAIFGHEVVKKGILLMLFGGVHKQTKEGISLRGDINVCVVGDPSVAKSQFLKYITSLVPRAVYTSGKASTAAGLTATVVKDPETGEYNIEAGALMLADSGICCIDEFDKMDPADQVAIHEAMEQQTISISKAGIHATLNARTSILAAANPIGGRYDKSRSLKSNLTITPAIMSRFDLLFVVLDKNDEISDFNIATHIVGIHQRKDQALNPDYTQQEIQRYIKFARTIKPVFTDAARQKVIQEYCALRMSDQGKGRSAWRITVRQLESMIRLSEAIARVHMEPVITENFVEEAARLLRQSIINIHNEDVELEPDLRPIPSDLAILDAQFKAFEDDDDHHSHHGDDDDSKMQTDPSDYHDQPEPSKKDESAPQPASDGKPAVQKRKTKITRERFDHISSMILLHLQRRREKNPDDPALRQSELLAWYLSEDAEALQAEQEDIANHRAIAAAVINKLITTEKSIIVLEDAPKADDRLLTVSEEYQLEGMDL